MSYGWRKGVLAGALIAKPPRLDTRGVRWPDGVVQNWKMEEKKLRYGTLEEDGEVKYTVQVDKRTTNYKKHGT